MLKSSCSTSLEPETFSPLQFALCSRRQPVQSEATCTRSIVFPKQGEGADCDDRFEARSKVAMMGSTGSSFSGCWASTIQADSSICSMSYRATFGESMESATFSFTYFTYFHRFTCWELARSLCCRRASPAAKKVSLLG